MINRNGRQVEKKFVDNSQKKLNFSLSTYGTEKSYPQQNVDFVDNLLLSVNSKTLSTFCGYNVENMFTNCY